MPTWRTVLPRTETLAFRCLATWSSSNAGAYGTFGEFVHDLVALPPTRRELWHEHVLMAATWGLSMMADAGSEASEARAPWSGLQDGVLCRGDGHSNRHGEVVGCGKSRVDGLRTSTSAEYPNAEQGFGKERGTRLAPQWPGPPRGSMGAGADAASETAERESRV